MPKTVNTKKSISSSKKISQKGGNLICPSNINANTAPTDALGKISLYLFNFPVDENKYGEDPALLEADVIFADPEEYIKSNPALFKLSPEQKNKLSADLSQAKKFSEVVSILKAILVPAEVSHEIVAEKVAEINKEAVAKVAEVNQEAVDKIAEVAKDAKDAENKEAEVPAKGGSNQDGGAKKKSAKKTSKKGSKKGSKGSKMMGGAKKGSKKPSKKVVKKTSKKSSKKPSKKGSKLVGGAKKSSKKVVKKGSKTGSKKVVKKTSKKVSTK